MQLCVVVRAFTGAHPMTPGDLVDVSGWRNAPQLIAQRYIRPATESELPQATEARPPRGRTVPDGK
jgi:hypothetical protein